MEDKKTGSLAHAKNIFEELKTNDNSVLFTKEKINDRLFKKLRKSQCLKEEKLVKLVTSIKDLERLLMLQNQIQIDQQFTVSMDHFNWFKQILLTLNFLVNQRLISNTVY